MSVRYEIEVVPTPTYSGEHLAILQGRIDGLLYQRAWDQRAIILFESSTNYIYDLLGIRGQLRKQERERKLTAIFAEIPDYALKSTLGQSAMNLVYFWANQWLDNRYNYHVLSRFTPIVRRLGEVFNLIDEERLAEARDHLIHQ